MEFAGHMRWWLGGAGIVSGVLDTLLFAFWGVDFEVGGRDLTWPVAAYLSVTFAGILFLVGHYMDARDRARRDAETIATQLRTIEETERAAAQNEKLAAIGRLAAGIAHEVRNPLGVIRASASMLGEGLEADPEAARAAGFITEECDRLNGLITALLNFARPAELHREPLRVETVVERALALAAGPLALRDVAVDREIGAVPEIAADADLLSQAVFDLVTNAAEAVPSGGHIALRVRGEAGRIAVEVADDGPGVPAEDVPRVFEPFFTTKPTGTGLGLAMTARIAESHGGRVEVLQGRGAGPAGRGACFRLLLPMPALEAAA